MESVLGFFLRKVDKSCQKFTLRKVFLFQWRPWANQIATMRFSVRDLGLTNNVIWSGGLDRAVSA